jgi:hypothetical protein
LQCCEILCPNAGARRIIPIAAAAEKKGVHLFRRFALMQRWCLQDGIPIEELVDPDDNDQLHMTDWATSCVTKALFEAITKAPPAAV